MATEGRGGAEASGIASALAAVRSRQDLIAVLLAADLFMPATASVEGAGRVRRVERAADVRYPVIVEDGERLVPVFTTEAAVRAALPEDDRPYVVARGAVLLAGWPPDAALYLDPGGDRSAKVPGDRVAALRDDVLGRSEPGVADPPPDVADAVEEPGAAPEADAAPSGAPRSWLERLGLRRPS